MFFQNLSKQIEIVENSWIATFVEGKTTDCEFHFKFSIEYQDYKQMSNQLWPKMIFMGKSASKYCWIIYVRSQSTQSDKLMRINWFNCSENRPCTVFSVLIITLPSNHFFHLVSFNLNNTQRITIRPDWEEFSDFLV